MKKPTNPTVSAPGQVSAPVTGVVTVPSQTPPAGVTVSPPTGGTGSGSGGGGQTTSGGGQTSSGGGQTTTTTSAPTTPAPASPAGFGLNDNSVGGGLLSADQDVQYESQLGATVERVTFDWRWAEATRGQYNFGLYDQLDAAMRAKGIRPLWILLWAPSWASAVSCNQYAQNCLYPPSSDHFVDAAHMAALLASRYPDSAGIEVWNEENLHWFWPSPDAGAYTQLLKDCYAAVKQVNPSMPVVLGGMSNVQTTAGGDVSLSDFLTSVYSDGGKSSMDAISFHPYPAGADLTLTNQVFQQVRSIRHQFGDDGRPLWATEIGLTTSGNMWPGVGDAQQATTLAAIYTALSAMPDVKMIIFHTLLESGDPSNSEYGYGLMTPDHTPRAAFCALAALRHSSYTCTAA